MSMMMMQRSLSVPLLLLLFCSLSGAKSLSEGGDAQESSALQQVSDAQEARMRQKRDAEEDKTYLQQNGDSVALELRLRQQSDLSALRKLLEEQRKLEQVAFGAALGPNGNRGPYSSEITLVYTVVYANVGNAYNPRTGIFTAPVKGVYYFSFSGHNISSRGLGLRLFKNGEQTVTVFNHVAGSRFETVTNGMNLMLEKGDQVYMRLRANTWIYDNGNHHSTFIGHLLFPL